MRKITSFFTMALLLAGFTTARADVVEELQGNYSVTVSTEVQLASELDASKWYVMYQSRGSGGYAWDRSYQVDGSYLYKSNGTSVITDGTTLASEAAQYMVRFVATGTDDVYYIQFGTGNYFGQTSSETTSSQQIYPVSSIYDAAQMHVYNISVDDVVQEGHFGFNLWSSSGSDAWRLDNNGSNSGLATWGTGEITSIDGNNDWDIYEVTLAEMTERDAALAYATSTYNTYADLVGTLSTSSTSEPGTYDADLVTAFEKAIEELEAIDGPDGDEYTAEQLNALADAVVAAYEAMSATWVGYAAEVTPGYYFIQTSEMFYETTTTEDIEDPESGEIIPGESTTTYLSKGLYSLLSGTSISARWMTPDGTAPFLWKVTAAGDKTYTLENMATDAQLAGIAQSTAVTMSTEIDTTMIFDYSNTTDDVVYYNIRMSGGTERGYQYVHCGSHSSGEGTSGNIVGWCNTYSETPAASEWKLVAVSDEEAAAIIEAYAPYKDEANRQANAETILEDVEPKLEIAEDIQTDIDTDQPLVNSGNISSPHSDAEEGEGDGYEITEVLLDGDATTFWHSDWHGEFEDDHHYLQVECADDAIPASFIFEFTRRTNSANQITQWNVLGTNDASAATDCSTCDTLAVVDTPYDSDNMTMTSDVIENTGSYKYLRFQCAATSTSTNSKFFHLSEFQIYPATVTINETSQAVAMGDIYTNMVAAVEAAEAEGDSVTADTYATLKEAYDAFIAVYVDPTDLRTVISDAEGTAAGVVIGTNPGQWSSDTAGTLSSLISSATTYDAAGYYTQTETDQYITDIEAAQAALLAAANQVEEGKWYNLRFATEEMYTENGWATSGAESDSYPSLYGKLVAVTESESYEDNDGNTTYEIVPADPGTVAVGHGLYLIDEEELSYSTDAQLAQFRFISVADTAYLIQNRATGLFLRAAGTSGAVTLSIHPTLWTNSAMGYGKNITRGISLSGDDQATLHSELATTSLVTWENTDVSSNTGFLIEEVEAVASDYEGTEFNFAIVPGNYEAMCYPVSVTGVDCTLYGVQVSEDGTEITLEVLENNTAAAGQPFIVIADIDDPEFYDASAEEEYYVFQHGYELNVTAGNSGRLNGTYDGTTAPAGSVIASDNGLTITKASSTSIGENSAYINALIADIESALTVKVTENIYDAIQTAVSNATQTGDIYSIDGTKVGTGNLSTVKSLKKGLYIVNGTKVLVK